MIAHEVLTAARDLIGGDRARQYGDKLAMHEAIARLWTAYLGVQIEPHQVALMMVLFKVARTGAGPFHADNFVDAAGYAAIAAEIAPR